MDNALPGGATFATSMRVDYENGDSYVGSINESRQRHGYGKMTFSKGDIYEGEYRYDKMHGKGVLLFQTGESYIGDFVQDQYHGMGIFEYTHGKYDGPWHHGGRHGSGTFAWHTGHKYLRHVGQYQHDAVDGQGLLEYADGGIYQGELKNIQRHGNGTMRYPDGSRYIGAWAEDRCHGQGQYVSLERGEQQVGEWSNGVLDAVATSPVDDAPLQAWRGEQALFEAKRAEGVAPLLAWEYARAQATPPDPALHRAPAVDAHSAHPHPHAGASPAPVPALLQPPLVPAHAAPPPPGAPSPPAPPPGATDAGAAIHPVALLTSMLQAQTTGAAPALAPQGPPAVPQPFVGSGDSVPATAHPPPGGSPGLVRPDLAAPGRPPAFVAADAEAWDGDSDSDSEPLDARALWPPVTPLNHTASIFTPDTFVAELTQSTVLSGGLGVAEALLPATGAPLDRLPDSVLAWALEEPWRDGPDVAEPAAGDGAACGPVSAGAACAAHAAPSRTFLETSIPFTSVFAQDEACRGLLTPFLTVRRPAVSVGDPLEEDERLEEIARRHGAVPATPTRRESGAGSGSGEVQAVCQGPRHAAGPRASTVRIVMGNGKAVNPRKRQVFDAPWKPPPGAVSVPPPRDESCRINLKRAALPGGRGAVSPPEKRRRGRPRQLRPGECDLRGPGTRVCLWMSDGGDPEWCTALIIREVQAVRKGKRRFFVRWDREDWEDEAVDLASSDEGIDDCNDDRWYYVEDEELDGEGPARDPPAPNGTALGGRRELVDGAGNVLPEALRS